MLSILEVSWESPVREILDLSRSLIFALDVLQMDCAMGFGFFESYIFICTLPLFGVWIYAIAAAVLHRMKVEAAPLKVWNAIGLIAQGLFIGFLMHGIKPFIYLSHPSGEQTLKSGPDILVGSSSHQTLMICGTIHLLLYGAGFIHANLLKGGSWVSHMQVP